MQQIELDVEREEGREGERVRARVTDVWRERERRRQVRRGWLLRHNDLRWANGAVATVLKIGSPFIMKERRSDPPATIMN